MTTIDRIQVPEALLRSSNLLPSAKLVWITVLFESYIEPQSAGSKTHIAAVTGLSRPTVYKALSALSARGWYPLNRMDLVKKLQKPSITLYTAIFMDITLSVGTRLFHGLMQLTTGFKNKTNTFKYSSLSKELRIGLKTIRNAISQLIQSKWLVVKQINQLAPISFTLLNPIKEQLKNMIARAERNIAKAPHKGEALMKEFLSLLISTDEYEDNSRPGFLRNVSTDSLMELDRYYPKVIAFEFNGTQHYNPTDLYDAETVEKQKARDIQKSQLCAAKGIMFVTIRAEDLTVTRMLSKIGDLLPHRNLQGYEKLIKLLEKYSAGYRKKVPKLIQV